MSWRDQLRESSFRGVPFYFQESSKPVGRRVQVHQYPRRDKAFVEDLGGVAKEWSIEAFVFGDDYMSVRDDLIEALNSEGSGEFIHPREGSLWVKAGLGSVSESTSEGGYAKFTILFLEDSQAALLGSIKNTSAAVESASTNTILGVSNELTKQLDAEGGQKADTAINTLNSSLSVLSRVNGSLSEVISDVSDVGSEILDFSESLASLIRKPAELINAFSTVLFSIYGAFNDVAGAFTVYRDLDQNFKFGNSVPDTTPTNKAINKNQALLSDSLRAVNTASAAMYIAKLSYAIEATPEESPFDNFDEVLTVRDALLLALDEISETSSYVLYDVIRTLRVQFNEHLNAHGVRLPRIHYHSVIERRPLLALAYDIVGDASLSEELRIRNKLKHPLFIEPGKSIEYMI